MKVMIIEIHFFPCKLTSSQGTITLWTPSSTETVANGAGYIELGSTEFALACKLQTGLYWELES